MKLQKWVQMSMWKEIKVPNRTWIVSAMANLSLRLVRRGTFAKGHLVHICETSVRMAVLNPVGLERIVYPLWSMNVLSKYKWLHKPCDTGIIVCLFKSKIQKVDKAVSEQPVCARMGRNFKATNVSLNSCKDELGAKKRIGRDML